MIAYIVPLALNQPILLNWFRFRLGFRYWLWFRFDYWGAFGRHDFRSYEILRWSHCINVVNEALRVEDVDERGEAPLNHSYGHEHNIVCVAFSISVFG